MDREQEKSAEKKPYEIGLDDPSFDVEQPLNRLTIAPNEITFGEHAKRFEGSPHAVTLVGKLVDNEFHFFAPAVSNHDALVIATMEDSSPKTSEAKLALSRAIKDSKCHKVIEICLLPGATAADFQQACHGFAYMLGEKEAEDVQQLTNTRVRILNSAGLRYFVSLRKQEEGLVLSLNAAISVQESRPKPSLHYLYWPAKPLASIAKLARATVQKLAKKDLQSLLEVLAETHVNELEIDWNGPVGADGFKLVLGCVCDYWSEFLKEELPFTLHLGNATILGHTVQTARKAGAIACVYDSDADSWIDSAERGSVGAMDAKVEAASKEIVQRSLVEQLGQLRTDEDRADVLESAMSELGISSADLRTVALPSEISLHADKESPTSKKDYLDAFARIRRIGQKDRVKAIALFNEHLKFIAGHACDVRGFGSYEQGDLKKEVVREINATKKALRAELLVDGKKIKYLTGGAHRLSITPEGSETKIKPVKFPLFEARF